MNKKLVIVICLLSAILCLSACSDEKANEESTIAKTQCIIQDEFRTEKQDEITTSNNTSTTEDNKEFFEAGNFDYEWYVDKFYRGIGNEYNILWIDTRFEDEKGDTINGTTSVISSFDKDSVEFHNDENGFCASYLYEWRNASNELEVVSLDYYPDTDSIVFFMTGSPFTGKKYDYSDVYYFDEEYTCTHSFALQQYREENKQKKLVQSMGDNISSRSFERFDSSNPEEDIIFIGEKTEQGRFKCEYKNTEFEIIQKDVETYSYGEKNESRDYVEYTLYAPDGSVGHMDYYVYEDKITINISGELANCCGDYIGLP